MNLALLISSLVAAAIGGLPNLPKGIVTAISAITGTLGVILKNGLGTTSPTTISLVLATLQGVISELKTIPGLSQPILDQIAVLEDALAAALSLHLTAVDPSQLQPITPVP